MFRKAYLPLFFLTCALCAAQNGITGDARWYVKPSFQQGFILVHRISIGHLVRGYPAIYEVSFAKPTLGNKIWHVQNNNPDIGVSLQVIDYKNPSQLGYGVALAPFAEIPFRPEEKKARLVMRMCWGAAWLTKKFDIYRNHKNIAIGSHLNAFVQFKWFWHIRLGDQLRFEPGFSFTHASNGKFSNPNLGLNIVALNAALNIQVKRAAVAKPMRVDSSGFIRTKNEVLLYFGAGVNERATNTELLPVVALGASVQRNLNQSNRLSLGADLYFDRNYNIDYSIRNQRELSGLNRSRLALKAGYAYNIGRLSFPFEVGYYVFQRANPDGVLVNRIGLRYYTARNLTFHLMLRSHLAVAYNFEAGVGYRVPF